MMPKCNQNGSKIDQKGCQKSMRKSMRKSMQNGTLKRRVGGRIVTPLSSTQSPYLVLVSQYHIPQCAVDSYIRPQPNPQNGPSAPLRGCAAGSTSQATTGRACCALYIRNGRKECKINGFRVNHTLDWSQRAPKVSQRTPKGSQRAPKWRQNQSKINENCFQN